MDTNTEQKKRRRLEGVIVSDKMMKTAVVEIARLVRHKKYKKYYTITKRIKAHNENGQYHTGDMVMIEEAAPYSKEKRWNIIARIKQEPRGAVEVGKVAEVAEVAEKQS